MDKLFSYVRASFKTKHEREQFCRGCGTTWAYIIKIRCTKQLLRSSVCINFERESKGAVRCEDLRPDVDWAYLRSSKADAA